MTKVITLDKKVRLIEDCLSQLMANDGAEDIYASLYKMRKSATSMAVNTSTEVVTDATQVKRNIYSVSPYAHLRRFLDADHAIDIRADECTEKFKIRFLLQYFHTDRPTGNLDMFLVVKNLQHLETVNALYDYMKGTVDATETLRILNTIEFKVDQSPSFSVARSYISSKHSPDLPLSILRSEVSRAMRKVFK